jgi:hypothetical protein
MEPAEEVFMFESIKETQEPQELSAVDDGQNKQVAATPNVRSPDDPRTSLISAVSGQLARLPAWFVGVLLLLGALGFLLKEAMPLLLHALGE